MNKGKVIPDNVARLAVAEVWGKRSVILAAFGLVGVGAVLGAGSVYYFYIRHKIEEHFALQSAITSELHQLKEDVEQIKSTLDTRAGDNKTSRVSLKSALKDTNRRTVKFANGYETADEDEYVTASSESEAEDYKPKEGELEGGDADGVESQEYRFLARIDELLEGNVASQHEAYTSLKINQSKLKDSCEYWWRFAKATHLEATVAGSNGDQDLKKNLAFSAFSCAERALKIGDKSADAHKWYAITIGSKGEFLGINDKIQNGFTFKDHIDKAVSLNPNDSTLYHLLGRFCFEVSQLSWIERRVAATLFSSPPSSTPKEALNHFETAERIGKPFKENRLFIAKCCIALNDLKNAARWLNAASALPISSVSDKGAQEEIAKLLPKYRKYMN